MELPSTPSKAFLAAMASIYNWDKSADEALGIIHRIMDLGTLEHVLALGRPRLVAALQAAPAGAMRPRSWWFWHYRLALADAAHDPPPMPVRRISSFRLAI